MKIKEIEGLIDFIAKSGLEEVNIETEQVKLAVKRNTAVVHTMAPATTGTPMGAPSQATKPAEEAANGPEESNHIAFKSPMVGTFYRSSGPEVGAFVKVGDTIKPGQKLCIIEAMKLFNEIEADVAGTIVKILVEDASPVEFDQPLFLVEPA
jgi:acetyl-CoA carboxylase biotin carboxyl carrier protein